MRRANPIKQIDLFPIWDIHFTDELQVEMLRCEGSGQYPKASQ